MGAALQCQKGSDALCTQQKATSCCAYMKVEKANDSPTSAQEMSIYEKQDLGFPTNSGAYGVFCEKID